MKVIITESQYNRAIDQFITYLFEPHEEKTYDGHPDSIFWVKSGEVIAEIKNSGFFWLKYRTWMKISEMFSLNYDETISVIKMWLKQHYGFEGVNPFRIRHLHQP
jgi:hypothetical protein